MNELKTQSAMRRRRGREFWLVALAFGAVCSVLILPLALHPYLPMSDLPNHMARRHIAANQAQNAFLSQYYLYSLQFIPNVAVDALHGLFGWRGDPYVLARLSVAVYIANFVLSVLVLSRVVTGGWRLWPLASALVAYNACLYWGFENYLFSVPFAIHGLSLWLLLEAKQTWLRLLVFLPFSLLIFFAHFFAFVAFAVLVAGREIQVVMEAPAGTRIKAILAGSILALPFLPPIVWLILQSAGTAPVQGNLTEYGGIGSRIEAALSLTTIWPFSNPVTAGSIFEALVAGILGLGLLFTLRKKGPRLVVAPVLFGPIWALGLVVLLAPGWLNGVAFAQLRFPFIFVAVVIAASRWHGLSRPQGRVLSIGIAVFIAARVAVFEGETARYSNTVRDLIAVLQSLPKGARLLPLTGQGDDPAFARTHHYPGNAVIERNALVPTLFQGVHSLSVRPEWKDFTHPWLAPLGYALLLQQFRAQLEIESQKPIVLDRAYWLNWENKFTHLLAPSQTVVDLTTVLPIVQISSRGAFALFAICPQSCP